MREDAGRGDVRPRGPLPEDPAHADEGVRADAAELQQVLLVQPDREPALVESLWGGAIKFEIDLLKCIYCGMCEEACPTNAIQLIPDFEQGEYARRNLVYEKEDLLISGTGKYHDYNFYRVAGVSTLTKDKGQRTNELPPVDVRSLMP